METTQVRDALRDLGWGKTKAACYCALAEYGSMKASEIAAHIDTRQEKVYNPLKRLDSEGYVLTWNENPTQYEAQNPRYVIDEERRRFEDDTDVILEGLEEAWARSQQGLTRTEEFARVLSGVEGMRTSKSRIIDEANETLALFDRQLAQTPPYTITRIEEMADAGKDVRIVADSFDRLEHLEEFGVSVAYCDSITRPSFCIADEKTVLLNVANQRASIVFEDTHFARIMMQEFEDRYRSSEGLRNET